MNERRLLRNLALAILIKLFLLSALWWIFVREKRVQVDAVSVVAAFAGALLIVAFSAAGLWGTFGIPGYAITSALDPAAASDPLAKTVVRQAGAWLANYRRYPLTMLVPAAAYLGAAAALLLAVRGRTLIAFVASAVALAGVIGTAGVSMFPFVMPSSADPRSSLTVWDSVSSHLTLSIMFWAALIFMPVVIAYTGWAYRIMAGKVTAGYIRQNEHSAY